MGGRLLPRLATYESNVPFALRFMVDAGLVGGGWAEVPPGAWWAPASGHSHRASTCQLEAHCRWDSVVAHAAEGEWARVAPLRTLSCDIECAGRRGLFPEPQHDPVIQIAAVLSVAGEPAPRAKLVLTLGSCSPLLGAQVVAFDDEPALLRRWARLLRQADPDVVLGYNIVGFDLPYLYDRAAVLGLAGGDAHVWGRVRGRCALF
jgi:DNA polymerase delta subunit 1